MIPVSTILPGIALLSVLQAPALAAQKPSSMSSKPAFQDYVLDYSSATDADLQAKLARIDADLRAKYRMTTNDTAAGVLDLKTLRLAMIHPDREEYAASVAKIGILLAWIQLHPDAATN